MFSNSKAWRYICQNTVSRICSRAGSSWIIFTRYFASSGVDKRGWIRWVDERVRVDERGW